MSISRKVLNTLFGLERFFVIGLLLVAVIGCISVGNFFGAAVSAVLAVALNAYYMLMIKRKRGSRGDGSDNDSTSAVSRSTDKSVKRETENIKNLNAARA